MKLKEKFESKIKEELIKELGLANSMSCPKLVKVVINSGLGAALEDKKIIDYMLEDITNLTGQRAVVAKAKLDISNFGRLRKGNPIGVYCTLRGEKMWSFLDKLVSVVLPGTKDFRGLSRKSFDGSGNLNIGIKGHDIFMEVDPNRLDKSRGLQVTIQTSTNKNDEAYVLLKKLGVPFRD